MDREFPVSIGLAPAAAVSNRKTVVRRGILWLELDRGFQRRNRFRIFFHRYQRHSQIEESVAKAGIEFRRLGKMQDGFVPLLVLARQCAQDIFRTGIGGIDLKLLLELSFGLFRDRWD